MKRLDRELRHRDDGLPGRLDRDGRGDDGAREPARDRRGRGGDGRVSGAAARHGAGRFLGAFGAVWAAFGLAAFLADDVLHHVVDATPWLVDRPWLISAAVLALGGAMQFAPGKRRSLAACRHPVAAVTPSRSDPAAFGRFGLRYGLDCLGASWALMLLMFAEGFANPVWMAALTALMVYEVSGRHAARAVCVSGAVLLLIALATLIGV